MSARSSMTNKSRQTVRKRLGRKPKPKRRAAAQGRAFQSSHESERQFHEMFDQAVVVITRTDPSGVLVDVNDKFCEMLGYSRDELVGRHNRDITHPDDYGHGAKFREEAMRGRAASPISNDKRFLRKDGTYIWVRRTLSTARDEEGRPQYVVAVVEDITERKALEQRFRDTFEQAAVGIFHTDLDGRYLRVNRKLCEITGYSEEELTGPSRPNLSFPDDFDSGAAERTKLLSGEISSHSNEKRYVRKDGAVIWVNRTESLARDEAGNPLYMIRVVEDITGRKETERQFRDNFEQAAMGIAHVDFDNRYIRVNRKFCEITGYSEIELIGKPASGPSHPDDVGSGNRERDRLRAGKIASFSNEKRYIRKDGTTIWVKRTESIARDGAGKPLYCIRVVEDITDRKEAAERYRATFDSAPVGIMHTAIDDDRILSANSRLCEMLGYTQGELCRMRTDDLIPPDYAGLDRSKYREKMLRGELESF
jgi:PAS domain S-box-containing protein